MKPPLLRASPACIFVNTHVQVAPFAGRGVTLYLMQSDHAYLRAGAAGLGEAR